MKFTNLSFRRKLVVALIAVCAGGWPSLTEAQLPDSFQVTVNYGEGNVTLDLTKHSVRSQDFRVVSWNTANGYVVEHHMPGTNTLEVRTYRGYVVENPNEIVMAVVKPGNLMNAEGHIGKGRVWDISNIDVSTEMGEAAAPAITKTMMTTSEHPDAEQNHDPFECASCAAAMEAESSALHISSKEMDAAIQPLGEMGTSVQYIPPTGSLSTIYRVHAVCDITSKTYDAQGGTLENALAYIEQLFNVHDFHNTRDVMITHELTEIIVRKEQFYADTSAGTLRAEWLAQGVNSRGYIYSQFPYGWSYAGGFASGKNFYNTGGEAVCNQALFHENGHNWGCDHYLYGRDTMGGNRPLHEMLNAQQVFREKEREIAEADGFLPLGTPYSTAVHPHTTLDLATTLVDTPITIDVLANDWDANGDTLAVKSFTTNTVVGGTVTESGGVLTYTPPVGYVGKDVIVYEAVDSTGLYTVEPVHVTVVSHDLTVHYAFEDSSGTTASDSSGNSINGELVGTTFSAGSVPGVVGNAISVLGNEGMLCGNADLIDESQWELAAVGAWPLEEPKTSNFFDPLDENFSVSLWFNISDVSARTTLIDKGNKAAIGWEIYLEPGGEISARIRPWDSIQGSHVLGSGVNAQPDGWYHVTMVINRSDDSVRLYVNGVESGSPLSLPAGAWIFEGRTDCYLGKDAWDEGPSVPILFDEVKIFSKALNTAEILAQVGEGNVPAGAPLPNHGSVNQPLNSMLSWSSVNPTYQHDVYFGTNVAAVASATTASPEYKGRLSVTSYDPGTLDPSTTYFWRIDEVDGGTTIPGSVWSFGTAYSELMSGLVLHLTMDNDDVQIADGVAHTADDIAVPAQDFQMFNATPGQPGKIGEAMGLNATADSLRSYAINPVIRPATGGVTISFWINTTSTQSSNEMVYDVGGAYFMLYSAGDLRFIFDGSSSGSSYFDTNINDGQWHHIVAHNNGAGTTTLYVDGASVGTQSESLHSVATLSRKMAIGSAYDDEDDNNLNALFDDFAVWQRALSISEISGIYSNGLLGLTFSDQPVLVNTSFEAAEGFTGYSVGSHSSLGSVTDDDGVIWTEISDARIWNRTDIPPDGVQALVLGINASSSSCLMQIPGTTEGIGVVSFDYASFSSSADADFSLLYNDNTGSGWIEVWSSHISGMDPDYNDKPWRTAEVAVNVPGDVDLKFQTTGTKGAKFDNVWITAGRGSSLPASPPAFTSDPFSASHAVRDTEYADSIADLATDPDTGSSLSFSKEDGPDWLEVSSAGVLSGTPGVADFGLNSFTVRVTDQGGLWDEAVLEIVVGDSIAIQNHSFEDGSVTLGVPPGWTLEAGSSVGVDPGGSDGVHFLWIGPGVSISQDLGHTLASGETLHLQYESSRAHPRNIQLFAKNNDAYQLLSETTEQIGDDGWPGISLEYTVAAQYHGQELAIRIVSGNWNEFDNFRLVVVPAPSDNDGDGIPDAIDPDDDNDGIPDVWEIDHLLDPLTNDKTEDPDMDSYDNWYEYVADTNPRDGNSKQTFFIEPALGAGGPTLRFRSSVNRRYSVEYRDDLNSGSWQDLVFDLPGEGSEMGVTDPVGTTNRYYRLRITLP